MWNRFVAENVAAEQVVILAALGCTKDQAILTVYKIDCDIYFTDLMTRYRTIWEKLIAVL